MIEPIIEATNVSKVLGSGATQVRALKDVNIALGGGQLTVLMMWWTVPAPGNEVP